jgi:hypothetical protein
MIFLSLKDAWEDGNILSVIGFAPDENSFQKILTDYLNKNQIPPKQILVRQEADFDNAEDYMSWFNISQKIVTVCDKCLRDSCLQGVFYCEDYLTAGTTEKTIEELRKLNLDRNGDLLPEI